MANSLIPISQAPAADGRSSAAANTYSNVNGLAALKKDPSSPEAIAAVAQQVDALFLQMMLKSMRDANAESGEPTSNEMGMYQDMFDKQISLQLSQRGGLGIGTQLTRQLAAQAAAASGHKPDAAAKELSGVGRFGAPATLGAPGESGAQKADKDGESPAKSGSSATPSTSMLQDAIQFVGAMLPTIQRAAASLGVSPVGMLAQAALETGWGKRMPHTADGAPSLNMFGIKADDHWTGARASANTVEFSGGVATARRASFRAYGSVEESVSDFASLLQNAPRYRNALAGGENTEGYINAMGNAGYATDPQYASKLKDMVNSSTFRTALIINATKL
jgi:flagellar protein FlgJ